MEKIQEKLKILGEKSSRVDKISEEKLKEYGLSNITLRPYQLDGVNWMIERYKRNHGCILGDEMGLGKTCQTISYLTYLNGGGDKRGLHLILSPLSVLGNWQTEITKFAPKLELLIYKGSKEERPTLQRKLKKNRDRIDVVLTTYEICLKDEEFLRKFQWHTLVVDEAHRLKNRMSLLHQALLDYDVEQRLLLTGTPVQNNLKELYSLLCFVAPKIFRERLMDDFVETFEDSSNVKKNSELHEMLRPFLLRRLKAEVVKDLPKKTEVVLYHGMSALQKKYYKAILTKDIGVFENENRTTKTSLMNVLMQLRKNVNHPYLFDGVEPEPFELGDHLIEASGKLVVIDQLLSYLQEKGHKVLMFSQMTRMLDILQDYLGYKGYSYERLDGSVRGEERYLAVQNFNADSDTFIFLLSTKAGGVGLNLVAADTIIFVDSDFNPQNDLQAAARAHRIGQTRPVKVIRLIGKSTVEEIVLKRAEAKLKLTETVIESGQFSLGSDKDKTSLIADDDVKLQDILKFGVDQLFANEDSSVEDIDFTSILGPTDNNAWSEKVTEAQTQAQTESLDPVADEPTESLYVFEGTDYSKEPSAEDQKAFDDLLSAQKALLLEEEDDDERGTRKNRGVGGNKYIAELPIRQPKKKLTPEEIEERKKKRIEAAEKRAKAAEEAQKKREDAAKRKREALWRENGYTSSNVQVGSDGEADGEEKDDEEDVDEDTTKLDIDYVVGDVTHPQKTGDNDAIVVHCVDDSGKWGYGGLFSALSGRSMKPEEHYELAGQMKDLSLGDAHLIPIDDAEKREKGRDYVALVVAQYRDRRGALSGIKLSELSKAFDRLYKVAKEKKASVHLPRIGHNTAGFNWYGTERLIRKQLSRRGIPTHIYYYPRRGTMKRKQTKVQSDGSESDSSSRKKRNTREASSDTEEEPMDTTLEPAPGPSKVKTKPSLMKKLSSNAEPLPTFMSGVTVFFHHVPEDSLQNLRRYLCAYDGDVHQKVEDETTHIVTVKNPPKKDELEDYQMDYAGQIKMVSTEWLDQCYSERKRVDEKDFLVELDGDD